MSANHGRQAVFKILAMKKVKEFNRLSEVMKFMKEAVRECGNQYYQLADVAIDMILLQEDIEELKERGDDRFGAKWYFGIRKDGTAFKRYEKDIREWEDLYARHQYQTAMRLYSILMEKGRFFVELEKEYPQADGC